LLVAKRVGAGLRGFSVVLTPAGEQVIVGQELARVLDQRLVILDTQVDLESLVDVVVAFPARAQPAVNILRQLNGRRNWISSRGSLVFVVSRADYSKLSSSCPDIMSTLRSIERVVFEGYETDPEEATWEQLRLFLESKFGRLDLRGFIRSEVEDSSFSVFDIYQPLHGDRDNEASVRRPLAMLIGETKRISLLLGPPGSGKSFFLRWLALNEMRGTPDPHLRRVPIHVSLAAFAIAPASPTLVEYILDWLLENELLIAGGVLEAMRDGRALLLLDGLDEAGDASSRAYVVSAITEFEIRYPKVKIVITSRQAGLDDVDIRADEISVSPLNSKAMRELLVNWCRLYELHRGGNPEGEARGRREGEQLAAQVMSSDSLRRLATTPLLATIIAIVHRSGVRLPEHRADLYEHIMRILVERWNQVRSEVSGRGPPLRMSDAIRLLGPVALEIIKADLEGAVGEAALVEMLDRALSKGNVRGVNSATDALQMFKHSLGLLVERTPGVFGFLHQTFVEFLAAHELIRSGELEALCKQPRDAFLAKWREVILLSAGIVGQVQAADDRLRSMIQTIVASSDRRKGRPAAAVPSLLAGLVADDPALTPLLADCLLDALVPKWWFGRQYADESMLRVASESARLTRQILQGMWAEPLKHRLGNCRSSLHCELLVKAGFMTALSSILAALDSARVEIIGILFDIAKTASTMDVHTGLCMLPRLTEVVTEEAAYGFTAKVPPGVAEMLLRKTLRPFWRISFFGEGRPVLTTNSFDTARRDGQVFVSTRQSMEHVPTHGRLSFVPMRATPSMMEEFAEIVARHEVDGTLRRS
jgi:hypothetical protein